MSSSADRTVSPARGRLKAWLQLVRVPNLPTVPGDPLAGIFLAADPDLGAVPIGRAIAVAAASLLIYAAGLIWNDIADVDEDRRDRPDRPLPSGRISVRLAAVVGAVLAAMGVALAVWAGARTGAVALILSAAALLYDVRTKRIAWLGPLNMALCRALSMLMGVSLVVDTVGTPRGLPFLAAGSVFVYIALVSVVAREEMSGKTAGWERWLPAAGMACGSLLLFLLFAGWGRDTDVFALAMGGIAAVGALAVCTMASAGTTTAGLPRTVGLWILCLLPMQASWCLSSGQTAGLWAGVGLLLAWPVAGALGKRFYSS